MTDNNGNGNGIKTEKIRKVIFNEVTFLMAVIGVVISVVLFITRSDAQLKQDVELIKKDIQILRENEMKHLQVALDEYRVGQSENAKAIQSMNYNLIRIMTKMGIE